MKDATENILSSLMNDAVAVRFNWAGTLKGDNPKIGFKKWHLAKIIFGMANFILALDQNILLLQFSAKSNDYFL